jgi:C-terminal processing protease CtpA/Prc
LPDCTWIHETGITPDKIIELPQDVIDEKVELTQENDTQLHEALNMLKK